MQEYTSLRIIDLRAALSRRALSTKGVKADLVQRLGDADANANANGDGAGAGDGAAGSASAVTQPGPEVEAEKEPSPTSNNSNTPTNTLEDLHLYIPAGCILYRADQGSDIFHIYKDLTQARWIHFEEVIIEEPNIYGAARVYILPDDVDNTRVDRSPLHLQQQKKRLLTSLNYSANTWNGKPDLDASAQFPTLSPAATRATIPDSDDGKDISLLKMFNSIPSPTPDIDMIDVVDDHYRERDVMSELLNGTVNGLTPDIYPYQCRSAASMYEKEVSPAQFLDPRLMEVIDQSGDSYYYDPVTGDMLREPRRYDGIRGGILAEEMGAGKTLICLALVAATREQTSQVPEIYQGSNITVRPQVASLMDTAAAVLTKRAYPWKRFVDPWRVQKLAAFKRNPGWYYLPPPESRRPVRGGGAEQDLPPPQRIYLSHATLIIVPDNLLEQWLQEIGKHTEGLKVHVIRVPNGNPRNERRDPLADGSELIDYDIILSTVKSLETLWKRCQEPRANGGWSFQHSLGRIHFRRCIVDEGHKLGNIKLTDGYIICLDELLSCLDSLFDLGGGKEGTTVEACLTEVVYQLKQRLLIRGVEEVVPVGALRRNSIHDNHHGKQVQRELVLV